MANLAAKSQVLETYPANYDISLDLLMGGQATRGEALKWQLAQASYFLDGLEFHVWTDRPALCSPAQLSP